MGGLGALVLAPPADGAMLIVPVGNNGIAALNAALGSGASLIGNGRLPGSLVVRARRDAIAGGVLAAGAMIVAAHPVLCGQAEKPA